jgi:CRISPR/Cas system CSM-associated protein Csm2 small subunit
MEKLNFAEHYLKASKELRQVYEEANDQKFEESANKINDIIVELRLLRAAILSNVQN